MKIVAQFDVPYYQILNEESELVEKLPSFAEDSKHLIRLYEYMVLTRVFDAKAIALQRTGKMGTYPSTCGQEAAFVGIGDAMLKTDILVPYYRDVGAQIQRGVKLSEILLYWGGDERGNVFACGGEDYPYSVPVGSQPLHAAGVATAFKIRGEKRAVLTVCGEGGSSEGDFYEAMNVAGVWDLPVVFVISNNQWAISVPRSAQTKATTIAQKAIAAGFQGEQIDGNDVIAVRDRVDSALKRAREEGKPTLLEIITYRQSDHTTADDANRYEPKGVREAEWKKEPIARLRRYLEKQGLWDEKKEKACQEKSAAKVEEAVQEYLNTPPAPLECIIDYLYEELPAAYQDQREKIVKKKNQEISHG